MEELALFNVAPWEILLLSLNGAGKTDEVCRTRDSVSWQMETYGSVQYGAKIVELTSVPLNSPEDLIQQVKNLKASLLES